MRERETLDMERILEAIILEDCLIKNAFLEKVFSLVSDAISSIRVIFSIHLILLWPPELQCFLRYEK